jgi:pimeloyl-ACP methyl ester carboxylesterase
LRASTTSTTTCAHHTIVASQILKITIMTASACEECQASFGCLVSGMACAKCQKIMCSTCAGKHPLIAFDPTRPDESNDIKKTKGIKSYCKSCFEETSVLNFESTYDDILPTNTTTSTKSTPSSTSPTITFVMVHGGGASRALYRPYAERLAQLGYRCILLDLPGHGTLSDTTLTLDACVDNVQAVLKDCHLEPTDQSNHKTIYLGGSLGAYTGFYVLAKLPDFFSGAILLDCGQNVGPDASLKAKAGLWFLKHLTQQMSNKGMMGAMFSVATKSPAQWKMVESTFGAGMWFQQGQAQVECLKTVAPAEYIPRYKFPILFVNGSADYRDSEDRWLSLCQDQQLSSLHVYDGGDHFFSHDDRFVEDLLVRIDAYATTIGNLKV